MLGGYSVGVIMQMGDIWLAQMWDLILLRLNCKLKTELPWSAEGERHRSFFHGNEAADCQVEETP